MKLLLADALPPAGDAVDELLQHVPHDGRVRVGQPLANLPEAVRDPLGFGVHIGGIGQFARLSQLCLDLLTFLSDQGQLLSQFGRVDGADRFDKPAHFLVQVGQPLL